MYGKRHEKLGSREQSKSRYSIVGRNGACANIILIVIYDTAVAAAVASPSPPTLFGDA
jgi:hypothetical protein